MNVIVISEGVMCTDEPSVRLSLMRTSSAETQSYICRKIDLVNISAATTLILGLDGEHSRVLACRMDSKTSGSAVRKSDH
jgi:hypothetical protein